MVLASRPVASLILRAALPVGAASITLWPRRSWIAMIDLIMVVFPVPGPPVMTITFLSTESLTARACCSERARPRCFSAAATRASLSIRGNCLGMIQEGPSGGGQCPCSDTWNLVR